MNSEKAILTTEQVIIPLKTQMTSQPASYFLSDRSFSPIELYWENLTIQASYRERKRRCPPCSSIKKTKTILNNVTGIAKPGSFTAILGPSGHLKCNLTKI
jgi:ABC-type multidrug transport system fused ATPase/permease subunit